MAAACSVLTQQRYSDTLTAAADSKSYHFYYFLLSPRPLIRLKLIFLCLFCCCCLSKSRPLDQFNGCCCPRGANTRIPIDNIVLQQVNTTYNQGYISAFMQKKKVQKQINTVIYILNKAEKYLKGGKTTQAKKPSEEIHTLLSFEDYKNLNPGKRIVAFSKHC